MPGLIGKKVGMTRIFNDEGVQVPVTVIEAGPCPVLNVRSQEQDGYQAVQLGYGAKKAKRTPAGEMGHAAKSGLEAAPRLLREFRFDNGEEYEVGQQLTVELFEAGDRIKVTGKTKGRGFQGVVKRHGFAGRPGGHGHPMSRTPGSLGPGTDGARNLIFVKGGVPGARDGYVLISK
jgi:large subunit ribosomal protein L3